ncbi:unnamed protein product [Phytophthora fragariaefolia]|uniref:Unnamed protein product n=1 Tax=Phytophthora fragariaefolia TaxID=1490495 RepID=A0A9W6Y8U2_9STRA|nr:unnamed protein product [Phytophthora fragariaefolia]
MYSATLFRMQRSPYAILPTHMADVTPLSGAISVKIDPLPHGPGNLHVDMNISTGSPNAASTHVAREDCPHLADPEWEALQRLATAIGEAAVAMMLRTLAPTEHHGVALGFIMKEQREVAARATVSTPSTPRVEALKLHVNSYVGKEGEPLLRWLVEVDTAITARRIVNALSKVAFAMSCFGGQGDKGVTFKKGLRYGPVKSYLFREQPAGAGPPAGDAVERVDIGHAVSKAAAPSERHSHCKEKDDKPNLVILKVNSKRGSSLRALVDCGASNNFVRLQSLARLNFEEVELPRSLLEVRLATGIVV